MLSKLLTLPPVLVTGGFVLQIWWVDALTPSFLWPLAVLLFAVATSVALWSVWIFHNYKTPILPSRTANSLITNGPFAVSRNPIYLAMALSLLATGLWLSTWVAIPITAAFIEIVTKTHILHEEHMLQSQFPEATKGYFARTPRWIGPL